MTTEPSDVPESLPLDTIMSACYRETARFRQGLPSDTRYCLELFRRALQIASQPGDPDHPRYADSAARDRLVEIYTEYIKAQINRRAIQTIALDDLVQQVWLHFWQAANSGLVFGSLGQALMYLQRTTVTTVLAARRKQAELAREASLQGLHLQTDGQDRLADHASVDPFTEVAKQRYLARIRELITDPLDRRVFFERYGLILPPREIARRLQQEGLSLHGRPPTARAVSDLLERMFERLADDPEIRDLLSSD